MQSALDRPLKDILGAALTARLARECALAGRDPAVFSAECVGRAVVSAEKKRRFPELSATVEPALERSLRAIVAQALSAAQDWPTAEAALSGYGLCFRPAGGDLAVHRLSSGERLAKASEVGPSYAALIRRFGAGFPGHPHRWLASKLLSAPNAQHGAPIGMQSAEDVPASRDDA
ncbi:MAG: hypothetical protein AAGM38_07695 [Pseudomonadota bacterium]